MKNKIKINLLDVETKRRTANYGNQEHLNGGPMRFL